MTDDALALCGSRLPSLFHDALARLRTRAQPGAREALAALRDREGGAVACFLRLEGEGGGEGYLVARSGALRLERSPADAPVRYALRVPGSAILKGFAWLDAGELDAARLGDALLGLASREAEKLFQRYPCTFEAVVGGVPEIGDLALAAALGAGELPDVPQFTLRVAWPDLTQARAKGESMQDLILSGRARIGGDSARAMMLAMTLAQLR